MSSTARYKGLFALFAALVLAIGIAACGGDDDDDGDSGEETTEASATAIEENPDNNGIALTIGSKNFTEQIILGEIYAQALEAAGYDVCDRPQSRRRAGRARGASRPARSAAIPSTPPQR